MTKNHYNQIEQEAEKQYKRREQKKRKRMLMTGKSVFLLQKLMEQTAGKRIQKIKKRKK